MRDGWVTALILVFGARMCLVYAIEEMNKTICELHENKIELLYHQKQLEQEMWKERFCAMEETNLKLERLRR